MYETPIFYVRDDYSSMGDFSGQVREDPWVLSWSPQGRYRFFVERADKACPGRSLIKQKWNLMLSKDEPTKIQPTSNQQLTNSQATANRANQSTNYPQNLKQGRPSIAMDQSYARVLQQQALQHLADLALRQWGHRSLSEYIRHQRDHVQCLFAVFFPS